MRYLRENEWIHIREEKKSKGKGRPIKLYKLTVPMDCIVGTIEQEIIAESRHVLQNIERLKNIAWILSGLQRDAKIQGTVPSRTVSWVYYT